MNFRKNLSVIGIHVWIHDFNVVAWSVNFKFQIIIQHFLALEEDSYVGTDAASLIDTCIYYSYQICVQSSFMYFARIALFN